ncbi:MAG TPA: hypothetical protein VHB50_10105 [Bryobacteraceae bacterium]|nr:hypothetical protein [Bryobacteraceae bacterium]
MPTISERLACLIALPALAMGVYLSAKLAIADSLFRANTPESVARAARLEPGNAAYHQMLAEHLESLGRSSESERELAARLSPMESEYWIGLGVLAESQADYARAQKDLLEAAGIDAKFAPRWALMNFYFRRQNAGQFWLWTRQALEISYGDLTPVFRLCWLMTDDADKIAGVIPRRKDIELKYLAFLTDTHRFEAAPKIALNVAREAAPEDVPGLLAWCDAAIHADPDAAREVWSTLCRKKLLPFDPLSLEKGDLITNGRFQTTPTEHGFDWKIPQVDGVFVTTGSPIEGVSVELSGDQPEDCVVLSQFIPAAPAGRYRLNVQYNSPDEEDDSGFSWEIAGPASGAPLARSADLPLGTNTRTENVDFSAGANRLLKLSLRYKRPLGRVRRKETLVIHQVGIDLVR